MSAAQYDVLVVGAGISGLLCAEQLKRAGRSVALLDKGRVAGGRMSTRVLGNVRWDHGAQFFTVRDARLQSHVDQWLAARVIREWFRHSHVDTNAGGYPRYCGDRGMVTLAQYLSSNLEVFSSKTVTSIVRDVDCWYAETSAGERFCGRELVITVPLPQALLLLETTGLDWSLGKSELFADLSYDKGMATMVRLRRSTDLQKPGYLKVSDSPVLTCVVDNEQKGISPDCPTVTLHATAEFAAEQWDAADAERGQQMIDAAASYLNMEVEDFHCHRWGFTEPREPVVERFFRNPSLGLTLAGDAFGGPRVEGSALSGIEAAAAMLASS